MLSGVQKIPRQSVYVRFLDKASRPMDEDACWEWTGAKSTAGYGQIRVGDPLVYAHRFSYEWIVGRIPEGLDIDHLCRNPGCVNPSHLEPVTRRENVRRGIAGLAQKARTHCPQGHPYDSKNTYIYRNNRQCRICGAAASRRCRAKRRRLQGQLDEARGE